MLHAAEKQPPGTAQQTREGSITRRNAQQVVYAQWRGVCVCVGCRLLYAEDSICIDVVHEGYEKTGENKTKRKTKTSTHTLLRNLSDDRIGRAYWRAGPGDWAKASGGVLRGCTTSRGSLPDLQGPLLARGRRWSGRKSKELGCRAEESCAFEQVSPFLVSRLLFFLSFLFLHLMSGGPAVLIFFCLSFVFSFFLRPPFPPPPAGQTAYWHAAPRVQSRALPAVSPRGLLTVRRQAVAGCEWLWQSTHKVHPSWRGQDWTSRRLDSSKWTAGRLRSRHP